MRIPYRQRRARDIAAVCRSAGALACGILGRVDGGPAQQLLQERRGNSFGPGDHGRGAGQVEYEVMLVQPHQPAASVRVGERQLGRVIDPAGALGQGGLEQVGAVGGEQERDISVLAESVHLVQQLE